MKKTIQTADIQHALDMIHKTAQEQIADGDKCSNNQMLNHGCGLDDAVTMMKILLQL